MVRTCIILIDGAHARFFNLEIVGVWRMLVQREQPTRLLLVAEPRLLGGLRDERRYERLRGTEVIQLGENLTQRPVAQIHSILSLRAPYRRPLSFWRERSSAGRWTHPSSSPSREAGCLWASRSLRCCVLRPTLCGARAGRARARGACMSCPAPSAPPTPSPSARTSSVCSTGSATCTNGHFMDTFRNGEGRECRTRPSARLSRLLDRVSLLRRRGCQ